MIRTIQPSPHWTFTQITFAFIRTLFSFIQTYQKFLDVKWEMFDWTVVFVFILSHFGLKIHSKNVEINFRRFPRNNWNSRHIQHTNCEDSMNQSIMNAHFEYKLIKPEQIVRWCGNICIDSMITSYLLC